MSLVLFLSKLVICKIADGYFLLTSLISFLPMTWLDKEWQYNRLKGNYLSHTWTKNYQGLVFILNLYF